MSPLGYVDNAATRGEAGRPSFGITHPLSSRGTVRTQDNQLPEVFVVDYTSGGSTPERHEDWWRELNSVYSDRD